MPNDYNHDPAPHSEEREPAPSQNRPADTLRDGRLKLTIWENQGERGSYYSTQLSKTYEDQNGQLRDGQNFGRNDLPKLAILSNEAYLRIGQLQRENTQSRAQENTQNQQQQTDPQRQKSAEKQPARSRSSKPYRGR